jgi:hypothetical protein
VTRIVFLWDERPGLNSDHIRAHGLTPALWETVYLHASLRLPDKDDPSIYAAEGRAQGQLFRIVYAVDGDTVTPLTIVPITGFPITRRGLRGNTP